MGLEEVPSRMGWAEAFRLMLILAKDPSSQVAAAISGWEFPATREALTLADLYDAYGTATFKKHKRYPRPWADVDKTRLGKTRLSPDKVRELLAARGPSRTPLPPKRPRDARGRFISTKE